MYSFAKLSLVKGELNLSSVKDGQLFC
jgi:hypothetical protein